MSAFARELAEKDRQIEALKAQLAEWQETWTDERGTVWRRPTAWAYAQACRVCDETDMAKIARLRADPHSEAVEALRARVAELQQAMLSPIACDVILPPATRFRKGVSFATLMAGINQRAAQPEPAAPMDEMEVERLQTFKATLAEHGDDMARPIDPAEAMRAKCEDIARKHCYGDQSAEDIADAIAALKDK